MRARLVTTMLLAAAVIALPACGGKDEKPYKKASAATPEPGATRTDETNPDEGEDRLSEKPKIEKPTGPPPRELKQDDIVEGDGAMAKAGSTVTVQYVGVLYDTGEQFDASWDRGEPFTFELGAGKVIPGWDKGVEGMRVGGRRRLVIPPDLAYGDRGAGGAIGPGETLVFVVDLVDVG